jgi:hypothetical protein
MRSIVASISSRNRSPSPSRLSAYFAASASAATAAAGVHSIRQATEDHPRFSRARSRDRTSGHGIPGSLPDWYAAHRRSSAALKAATASGEWSDCVGSKLAKSSSATAARSSSLRASTPAPATAGGTALPPDSRPAPTGSRGSRRCRCSKPDLVISTAPLTSRRASRTMTCRHRRVSRWPGRALRSRRLPHGACWALACHPSECFVIAATRVL